ncbi:g13185 [Coccomyxa viridis]|uniref:G13185 protein n=1 Tax=Coccomyxa viridis TaxID=1274662 RepID=A0ABP1GHP7_9CHLO
MLRPAALTLTVAISLLHLSLGCTILELTDEGFSRNVLWLLHGYSLYTPANGTFYLDATQWPFKCTDTGGWGDFFATSDELVLDWTPGVEQPDGRECARVKADNVIDLLHTLDVSTAELDGMAVTKLWKLQPWLQQQVNATLRELRGLRGPTVAFHVRGGDLLADLTVHERPMATPASMVERAIEAFGSKAQGGTCILVGDDQEMLAQTAKVARKQLGCSIYRRVPTPRKGGYIQREFTAQPLKDRCQQTVQLMQDIHLMMHADYFVGSFDSQLPRMLETLRFALLRKNRRSFVDASPRREDWYETVRKYWREHTGGREVSR